MTTTEVPHPDRTLHDNTIDDNTEEATPMTRWPLVRLAGPLAVTAGALITLAQLMMLPFDPKDHQVTSQSPVFQVAGVVYLLGFCALMLTVVGAYGWVAERAGRFGVVAVSVALVGTMLLAGDLWFETFAVPSIADGPAPQVLDSDPSILLGLGAISSYLLFAIGWVAFGIAAFRARVPKAVSAGIVIGGVVGFNALLSPFGVPLALAVAALGMWMIGTTRSVATDTRVPVAV